jgi:hypothetical protein
MPLATLQILMMDDDRASSALGFVSNVREKIPGYSSCGRSYRLACNSNPAPVAINPRISAIARQLNPAKLAASEENVVIEAMDCIQALGKLRR